VIEHHTQPAATETTASGSPARGAKRTRGGGARSRRPSRVELE
jgi:hypothetical protein